jgi:hypothetical protein
MTFTNFFIPYLYNKRVCPTKNEPQQGISYLEREREGVRESERCGRVSRQAYLRFSRDRGERQRYREIERHRNKETELTIKIPSKAG